MRIKELTLAATLFFVALLSACDDRAMEVSASTQAGGNAQRGIAAISRYGCGSCHTIGGIASAHGLVGPPLTMIRNRMYVAGMLENTASNLESWIRDPKAINPKTAMPTLGVSRQEAADIATYLYSIH